MDETEPLPRAQPPAWPVDAGNSIRGVAVGPFGLHVSHLQGCRLIEAEAAGGPPSLLLEDHD
jgi:hypothetical protein